MTKKLYRATVYMAHGEFCPMTSDMADTFKFILDAEDDNEANQKVLAWVRNFNRDSKNERKAAYYILERIRIIDKVGES